jgi:DMSO/TMAO reductase YedYZ heme-binding membrane subunit
MSPQVWWFVARGSGITAWLFLTASIMWGIVLGAGLFPKHRRPAWLLDLHRALGGLVVCFVGVHVGALIADNYVHFDVIDVLVPFAANWKTWQVALGVLALWGVVAVELTSLAMKHLRRSTWRAVHLTSYVVFVLTSLHGTFAGTDASNRLYLATSIAATVVLMVAVIHRILLGVGRGAGDGGGRLARHGDRVGTPASHVSSAPPVGHCSNGRIRSIPGEPFVEQT